MPATYSISTSYSDGVLLARITVVVIMVPAIDHPIDAASVALDRIWRSVIAVTGISLAFYPPKFDAGAKAGCATNFSVAQTCNRRRRGADRCKWAMAYRALDLSG